MKIKITLLLVLFSIVGWGQTNSYLGLDGGFEGSATIINATTNAAPVVTNWTKSTATATIAGETTTVRSGNNSLRVNSTSATLCRVFSPSITVPASTTRWVVQYYRRAASTTNGVQNQSGNYRNGTEQTNGAYTTVTAANTWEKVTYQPTSVVSATTAAADMLVKMVGTGGDMFYDDFALYESAGGTIDVTAPNAPTVPLAANPTTTTLDISWTAATGGVDGGGYIVVRGIVDPTTAPNVNGIYAVGNTIAAGMTVVYNGTGTSFTDSGLTSGTTYFYRIYTYDKAYNYSASASCNGTTTSTCIPPANPVGAISGTTPACGSTTLSFSGTATAPVVYYWQTVSGGTSIVNDAASTLNVTTSGNYYVRAKNTLTNCWSAGESGPYAVVINTAASVSTQPSNISTSTGSNASFSVVATNATGYQWQVDTGSGFTNLSNGGVYSNVTTATMTITGATLVMNGYQYRCIITANSPCPSVISNSAILTVTVAPIPTTFKPGDLVFVGYDSIVGDGACTATNNSRDKFYIATFVDIKPGTSFMVVNSRYEAGAAANVRTDKWYSGGSAPFDDPGYYTFTWNGVTNIPKGSIISFKAFNNLALEVSVNNVLEPLLNWTASTNQCNISSADADQIYLMQGTFTSFGTVGVDRYDTFSGRVLYGLTNGVAWIPITSAVSAGTTGGTTRQSRLPDDIECFNIESIALAGARYYNNSSLRTGSKNQLLSALVNVANWTIPVNDNCLNTVEDFTGVTGAAVGGTFTINPGNPDGTWTGASNTDWFVCGNWEGLAVPKSTDDVIIPNVTNKPIIGASPSKFPSGAFSNNLTINTSSSLTMSNVASVLNLYGNWTNNAGSANFNEGTGTVYFNGSAPQVISPVTPEGTETFYNVILNNDFTTSTSNDLIATGDLTVNSSKTLTINSGRYAQVNNILTNSGTVDVQNNGSLVQVNNVADTGSISVKRDASQRLLDYVYWSSPVQGFGLNYFNTTGGTNYIYEWNPVGLNANGGEGNWSLAAGNMTQAKGYIVRGNNTFNNTAPTTWTANFTGVPNNGTITIPIQRGNDYTTIGTQGIPRTALDDNWNLVGNPYPSAIGVNEFLAANASINGFVKIWTHAQLPTSPIDPFYQDFQTNYYAADYTTINSTGLTSGPGDYKIGAGQGFFVLMNAGVAGSSTVTFNNAMRSRTFANNQFYKTIEPKKLGNEAKSRIWLDLVSSSTQETTRTLVGYVEGATTGDDRLYDAVTDNKNSQNFYSLIDNSPMIIQGRSLPFDINDQVPMGIKVPSNGIYTIAIATVDGLFKEANQKIFIEDKIENTVHDLTLNPYTFSVNQGVVNDRFVLRFTNPTLGTNNFDSENAVRVYGAENAIKIKSTTEIIKDVVVYNVLGQILNAKSNLNSNDIEVNSILKTNQALIVKVAFTNGQVVVKKLVY